MRFWVCLTIALALLFSFINLAASGAITDTNKNDSIIRDEIPMTYNSEESGTYIDSAITDDDMLDYLNTSPYREIDQHNVREIFNKRIQQAMEHTIKGESAIAMINVNKESQIFKGFAKIMQDLEGRSKEPAVIIDLLSTMLRSKDTSQNTKNSALIILNFLCDSTTSSNKERLQKFIYILYKIEMIKPTENGINRATSAFKEFYKINSKDRMTDDIVLIHENCKNSSNPLMTKTLQITNSQIKLIIDLTSSINEKFNIEEAKKFKKYMREGRVINDEEKHFD